MDWHLGVAIGVFLITIIAFTMNSNNNYLSLREHTEFRDSLKKEIAIIRDQVIALERTRPTTGELKAMLDKA